MKQNYPNEIDLSSIPEDINDITECDPNCKKCYAKPSTPEGAHGRIQNAIFEDTVGDLGPPVPRKNPFTIDIPHFKC